MRAHPLGRTMSGEPWGWRFQKPVFEGTATGRNLDPSSGGHGESAQPEGDTGFQGEKRASSGPGILVRKPRCGAPGKGIPGARVAGSRGLPAEEGALGWRSSTRLGPRQGAPAEHSYSTQRCFPLLPETGSALLCWLCARVSRTPAKAGLLSKEGSVQTVFPSPTPFPNTDDQTPQRSRQAGPS